MRIYDAAKYEDGSWRVTANGVPCKQSFPDVHRASAHCKKLAELYARVKGLDAVFEIPQGRNKAAWLVK